MSVWSFWISGTIFKLLIKPWAIRTQWWQGTNQSRVSEFPKLTDAKPNTLKSTGETFSPQKRTSSTSKHEIYEIFSIFVGQFCPPGFGSGLRIRFRGPHWIWIQSGSGSTTLHKYLIFRLTCIQDSCRISLASGLRPGLWFSIRPKHTEMIGSKIKEI